MSGEPQGGSSGSTAEADFAQAFKELARGESAAAALENHLDSLEKKIEDLLAKADEEEQKMKAQNEQTHAEPLPAATDDDDKATK